VLCDGKNVLALATSQDHKRLRTATKAPTPAAWAPIRPRRWSRPDVHARAMREIILPTIRAWKSDGIPFTGFLYAGLMIDAGPAKTLEFNCRMGDPETQPIMMRLKSDLFEVLSTPPTASSTRSSCSGTAAPRWAWCWPRTATR
jgi:phosphoribosylamine--glycine ligase